MASMASMVTCFTNPVYISVEFSLELLLASQFEKGLPVLHPFSFFGEFSANKRLSRPSKAIARHTVAKPQKIVQKFKNSLQYYNSCSMQRLYSKQLQFGIFFNFWTKILVCPSVLGYVGIPAQHTQHEVEHEEWAYNDERHKVYGIETIAHGVVGLKDKIKWFFVQQYVQ